MKLHILSDLHTEFAEFTPPKTDADVVILAGDIGVGTSGLAWASGHFADVPVIYVPGNHECYNHDTELADALKVSAPGNIRVLNNDSAEIEGVRILGCTLWTDFKFYGADKVEQSQDTAASFLNDFRLIRHGYGMLTPENSVYFFRRSVHWLVTELDQTFDGPTVVVTHHLPSAMSVSTRFANDPLNPAFASRMEGVIEKYQPELWIHGHTHVPCDYELYGTRVVCNPRGYPGESLCKGFLPGLVVEVRA